jgi:hypothetical protein
VSAIVIHVRVEEAMRMGLKGEVEKHKKGRANCYLDTCWLCGSKDESLGHVHGEGADGSVIY